MNDTQPILQGDERTLAIVAHLLGLVSNFLGPLILFLALTDKPLAREEAREALNFQITVMIASLISALMVLVVVGLLLLPLVGVAALVLSILAAISVSDGRPYRYPFILRLV